MINNSKKSKVDYLVGLKFGHISKAPPPLTSRGNSNFNHEQHRELISKVKAYEGELFALADVKLNDLLEQETAKARERIRLSHEQKERQRFYNQPSADADFVYWSIMADWTLDEAIALSFGKNPKIVNWDMVQPVLNERQLGFDMETIIVPRFADEYSKRRDLALRALRWKKLYDPVLPSIFLGWAKELQLVVPVQLVAEVEKIGGTAINWFEKYQELKTEYSEYKATTEASAAQLKEMMPQLCDAISTKQKSNASSESFIVTKPHELQIKALQHFFSPRKSVDAKKVEVVNWILEEGKSFTPPVSDNIAQAIFTIIKPTDHNPSKRRDV